MRKTLTVLLLLLASSSYSMAQGWKGFALGADRDTLMYIIASPFDNWYINVGGGIQTFIGNEVESSARHNKLNYNVSAEIGKWIIPDLAVSLRLGFFDVSGQSHYSLQPFIDYTGVPVDADGNYEYQPFHAHAFSLMGFVTFDWTNFFCGYERGRRNRLHIFTPIGFGASMLFGKQINPNPKISYDVGDFRRNFELSYSFRIGAEYTISRRIAVNATLELLGSESTWDWSPYDNNHTIFDIIPSFNVACKLNLLKSIKKYNPYTHESHRENVYHEFLAFGSRNTIQRLNGEIDRLYRERDSIQDLAGTQADKDAARIAAIDHELDSLKHLVDHSQPGPGDHQPRNIFEDLLDANEKLNLPATIVYYQLDKYDLDYNACKRLEDFAKEARLLDDTIEFYIIGAADSVTGSIRHNQWLSERRSEAAYNMLVNSYRLNANQLIRVNAGGIDVYDPKENNRMAMVIQRTPVTEEIVERWLRMSRERLKK